MLDDIFKALLEGAQSQSQPSQPAQPQAPLGGGGQQDMLTQLLQGALQGQQPPPQANEPANLAGMSGLLGGLLGGMGGGSSQNQVNPLIAPIANMLAEKLNISPAIASMVVNFALTALLARGKRQPGQIDTGSQEPAFDLDDIVNGDFAFSSGMAEQLSRQTGLPEQEAARSLQEAMVLLNDQAAAPSQMSSSQQPSDPMDDILGGIMDALDLDQP